MRKLLKGGSAIILAFLMAIQFIQYDMVHAGTSADDGDYTQTKAVNQREETKAKITDNSVVKAPKRASALSAKDEVTIPDKNLKEAIVFQLSKQGIKVKDGKITKEMMEKMSGLDNDLNFTQQMAGKGVKNLDGLQYATNITRLHLGYNEVTDLSPLKGLKKLQSLKLDDNYIKNVSPLSSLTELKKLNLSQNEILDARPIADLRKLEELNMYGNRKLTSIAGFDKLTDLKKLNLGRCIGITDISPLASSTKLEELYFYNNKVEDISKLSKLTNLKVLSFYANRVKDISSLKDMKNLKVLDAHSNKIQDISPIKELKNLQELYIQQNQIADVKPLSGLAKLKTLYMHVNKVTDISMLGTLTELESFNASGNKVINIDVIKNFKDLDDLVLDNCGIKDISVLKNNTNLVELSLQRNEISDISALSSMPKLKELKLGSNHICDLTPLGKIKHTIEFEARDQTITREAFGKTVPNPVRDMQGKPLKFNEGSKSEIKNVDGKLEFIKFDQKKIGDKAEATWTLAREFSGKVVYTFANKSELKITTEGDINAGNQVKVKSDAVYYTKGRSIGAAYRLLQLHKEHFISVAVDGKLLKAEDYDVKEGSIVVNLKKTFIDTLKPGEHKVTINTTEGSATGILQIQTAKSPEVNNNGSNDNVDKAKTPGNKNAGVHKAKSGRKGRHIPKTGDFNMMTEWIMLFLLAGTAVTAVRLSGKKK